MLRSSVTEESAGAVFAAAANADCKGLAQWLTPPALAAACAALLPTVRHAVCDLTCGDGALLDAAARGHKGCARLGLDVDAAAVARAQFQDAKSQTPSPNHRLAVAELTEAGALLAEVDWRGDLFALNPPWSLHFYRDKLAYLAESQVLKVREAFAVHDGRTPRDCIDSTVATLLLALDRCTLWGEGFLIGYESTLQRLILADDAPYGMLAAHVWAYATVSGEEFGLRPKLQGEGCKLQVEEGTEPATCNQQPETQTVGIIWFAAGHYTGPVDLTREFAALRAAEGAEAADIARRARWRRHGSVLHDYYTHWEDNLVLWDAIRTELAARRDADRARPWHLWLQPDGTIGTQLSRFEKSSDKVDKQAVVRLHRLTGKRPLQLVVQREERDLLRRTTAQDGWRVEPRLAAAVATALAGYHVARAPLTALSPIQRLGYLDEENSIQCARDLLVVLDASRGPRSQNPAPIVVHFWAGQVYPLRSRTIPVARQSTTIGLSGDTEHTLLEGAQLVFHVSCGGCEVSFLDASLRAPGHTLDGGAVTVDATLQEMVAHFVIPEVPDVASLFPEKHTAMLARLDELEVVLNE